MYKPSIFLLYTTHPNMVHELDPIPSDCGTCPDLYYGKVPFSTAVYIKTNHHTLNLEYSAPNICLWNVEGDKQESNMSTLHRKTVAKFWKQNTTLLVFCKSDVICFHSNDKLTFRCFAFGPYGLCARFYCMNCLFMKVGTWCLMCVYLCTWCKWKLL